MKQILLFGGTLGLLIGALLFNNALISAQGPLYELSQSLFGGGGVVSGGPYAMTIVIGDPVVDELSGGNYRLGGGILGGGPRMIAPVTPTSTFTPQATPTTTSTPIEEPLATATTMPDDPTPTATATTTPDNPAPTATATPTAPVTTDVNVRLLSTVGRALMYRTYDRQPLKAE